MREFRWSYVNPLSVLKDVLTHLWLVALCAAIAWMGTQIALENVYRPEYTSSATFFITPKDSTSQGYASINAGNQMAGVLGNIFKSQILANKAAEAMGRLELPARVDARVVDYTNLLRLSATGPTPEAAFQTVRAIMDNHAQVSDYVATNVVAEVLEDAVVPVAPSNHIPLRSSQRLAALLGAALAVAIILLLSVLRDTVKTEEGIRQLIDAPHYGTLPFESKNKTLRTKLRRTNKALIITNPLTSFQYTQGIKRISTKLEYAASLRGQKVFLVSSAGENEGKSSMAANLALDLASRSQKVLLIDADLRRPAQYKLFDIPRGTHLEFADVLLDRATLSQALYTHQESGLHMLLNRQSYAQSAELVTSPQMMRLLQQARGMMDYIIVDSAPVVLASDTEALASLCDTALLVVRQDYAYVYTINDTIDKLAENTQLLGSVFNAARTLSTLAGITSRRYGSYYTKA